MIDLLIRNASLRSFDGLYDIAVDEGKIVKIGKTIEEKGEIKIDAEGKLVTESFVNPHLHLCKVYTFLVIGREVSKLYHGESMSDSIHAIEAASKIKEKYSEDWILENAEKAALEALKHGCTHVRAFVDTDTKARLEGVKAILKLREKLKNFLKIQVVAFPQEGVIRDQGAEEYVWKAVEMGCDVVGGIPWVEYTEEDSIKHIDTIFRIAKTHDKDIAMLTDDAGDPSLRTTEMLAVKTIKENWYGRVTACHARAMQLYPSTYFTKLTYLLKHADVSIVANPHTGPLHAKIRELLSNGVNVALGQDDIADAYYPFGRSKMLEIAFLCSHILWMMDLNEMETLYHMITQNAAKAMNIKDYGLRESATANLVVLNARSVYEAIWYQSDPLYVISNGRLVVENKQETVFRYKEK